MRQCGREVTDWRWEKERVGKWADERNEIAAYIDIERENERQHMGVTIDRGR